MGILDFPSSPPTKTAVSQAKLTRYAAITSITTKIQIRITQPIDRSGD
jgi:hypothetical protein